jgi:uncharacterized protein (TIGR04255 family)
MDVFDTMLNVTAGHVPPPIGSSRASSPFPDSPRVIYKQNSLIEVVGQLRFAPILRIDTEPPADFQERVRLNFPVLTERTSDVFQVPPGLPPQFANLVRSSFGKQALPSSYDFVTADGLWTIQLTRDSLALTTTAYKRWEDFKARFEGGLKALVDVYKPAFFTRVGLRYQNLIQRSRLHLDSQPWSALLKPRIAGLVGSEGLDVSESLSIVSIRLPQADGHVRIRHGLAQAAGASEECYLIDSDFFTEERISTNDAFGTLDYFNSQSGHLFRWCIEDRLHDAMEPERIARPSAPE